MREDHGVIEAPLRRLALLVAGCFFLENLDATIVTTAAPAIGRSLRVAPSSVGLVVTAYLLTVAVLVPVSAWLARRWGPRRTLVTAIAVFTLSSLACAGARSLPELVALRVVQGAGGAMMVPVGRLLVLRGASKSDLLRLIAWLTWPGLVAPVVAPLVGGLLTSYLSWRAIFGVNVPLGLLALLVAARIVPATPGEPGASLDRVGALLTVAGLGGLAWTAHLLATASPQWPAVATWGAASLLVTAAAVRHLLTARSPLIALRTLAVPTFRASVEGSSLFWLVVGAVPFLLPLLFQTAFGWSPVRSGAVVLLVFVGNLAIKPATTPLLRRLGFRVVLLGATTGVALTVAAMAALRPSTPLPAVAALLVVSGIVRSTGFTAYNTVALADTTEDDLPSANALYLTAQQLSAAFSIAAASLALRAGSGLAPLVPGRPGASDPFAVAFVLLALVAVVAAVLAGRLHARAGDSVR